MKRVKQYTIYVEVDKNYLKAQRTTCPSQHMSKMKRLKEQGHRIITTKKVIR